MDLKQVGHVRQATNIPEMEADVLINSSRASTMASHLQVPFLPWICVRFQVMLDTDIQELHTLETHCVFV